MIIKFEKYNESRLFKEEYDTEVKAIVKNIKDTFDYTKLKIDELFKSEMRTEYKFQYNNIIVAKTKTYGFEGGSYTGYFIYIDEKIIHNVSKYIIKDLYNFFEDKISQKKKDDIKKTVLSNVPTSVAKTIEPKRNFLKKFLD